MFGVFVATIPGDGSFWSSPLFITPADALAVEDTARVKNQGSIATPLPPFDAPLAIAAMATKRSHPHPIPILLQLNFEHCNHHGLNAESTDNVEMTKTPRS